MESKERDENKTFGIEAIDIYKTFHTPVTVEVLRGITLRVKKGESTAIMGASGEGKSTLLHILGSLEAPCQGRLIIAGKKLSNSRSSSIRNHHVGFVFQTYNLLEDCTSLENILMPARIGRKNISPGSECHENALALLEKVGLSHRAEFSTKLLSGGEKQRIAIARALCNNPDLLLADEPSGNLDHNTSLIIHDLLLSCASNEGKALVVATHDKELAKLCDHRYDLKDGRLFQE
jgi:lipoprotein-releasing system ATP-binding protein